MLIFVSLQVLCRSFVYVHDITYQIDHRSEGHQEVSGHHATRRSLFLRVNVSLKVCLEYILSTRSTNAPDVVKAILARISCASIAADVVVVVMRYVCCLLPTDRGEMWAVRCNGGVCPSSSTFASLQAFSTLSHPSSHIMQQLARLG